MRQRSQNAERRVDSSGASAPDGQERASAESGALSLVEGFVLALVIEKASYAYLVHDRLGRYADVVSTSRSNVYDVLGRLEEAGYVAVAGRSGPRGRPRVNFRATDEGMTAHLAWLAECLRDPERFMIAVRLASVSLRRPGAKLELIDRFVKETTCEASQIAMPEPGDEGELFIELRRRVVDAMLQWGVYARSREIESGGGPE
jgi:DNA-binding PadR family transcriptional regulator